MGQGHWGVPLQGLELLVLLLVLLVLVDLQSVVQLMSFVAPLPLAGGEGSSCQCRIPPTPRSLVELHKQWVEPSAAKRCKLCWTGHGKSLGFPGTGAGLPCVAL